MKHYLILFDKQGEELSTVTFPEFNKELIRETIVNSLSNPEVDEIQHEKESNDKKYAGNDIINFYARTKSGLPARLILKGNQIFYKLLNKH